MKFAVLGPIELRAGDRRAPIGGPRQVTLLAFFLVHRNRAVSTDLLHDALWSGQDQPGASKRVQMAVARLRESLAQLESGGSGEPALRTVSGGYMLVVGAGDVDAELFQEQLAEGRALLAAGDAGAASRVLREALALWRGPALAEVAFEDFAAAEIRHLEELRLEALEARVEADLALDRHGAVVGELQAVLAEHPGRERVCQQLMIALYRSGRQSDALDAYQQLSTHLSTEFGLRPGPALQSLQRAVLEHAAWLDRDASSSPTASEDTKRPDEAAPEVPAQAFPLPPAMAAGDHGPFVGRAAAIEQVAASYEQAASGTRRIVLLCGEPGIGKTRLQTQIARDARDAGAIVLYGRCDEDSLLPHQPFVEALRHYVRHCPESLLATQVELVSGELRRVVPELAERVPELSHPLSGDPDGARHRLFEAIAAILCAAAQPRPLVLLLDDLQWADEATLLLLKYVARYPRDAPLMIVCAYRDTDVDYEHPLSAVLADLDREQIVDRVALGRLDETAVSELVGWHIGDNAPADVRRMVFEETQGLAFFVVEVSRHLSDSARDARTTDAVASAAPQARLPLPEGVTRLIRSRLARLGPEANRVLETAAVLGSSFTFELLERVCDHIGVDELVDAIEAALRAQLIDEPRGGDDRYAFSHALIRDVLYEMPSQARRALLHRRAAAAIEAAHAGRELPFAELARHLGQAGAAGDLDRALRFETLAADSAIAMLAYEQAAAHLREALALLDRCGGAATQRCDLTIALGEAQRMAGDRGHRETLLRAAALATELGDAARLSRAALANNRGYNSSAQGVDRARVAVLEDALELVGEDDPATRADLMAQLAVELVADAGGQRRRAVLSDAALAIARSAGDPATLARVLTQHSIAQWLPSTLARRNAHMREAVQLAEAAGERVVSGYATFFGYHMAVEAGDFERSEELLASLASHVEHLRQPLLEWFEAVTRTKRCLIVGSPKEAELLAFDAQRTGRRSGQHDAGVWLLGHLYVARLLQGTLEGGEPDLAALFQVPGSAPVVGPEFAPGGSLPLVVSSSVSAILTEVGRLEEARAHLDLVMKQVVGRPTDYATLSILASSSIACAHLGDNVAAEQLHAGMAPCAGQFVGTGSLWLGAVVHHLAVLETAMGRLDDADEHFAAADRGYAGLAAVAWLARSRLEWASMLLQRGRERDAERASALTTAALEIARDLDLSAVEARASALRERASVLMQR